MAKNGHHKSLVKGQWVVVMPAPKFTPWHLTEDFADTVEREDVLNEAEGSGSEAAEEDARICLNFAECVDDVHKSVESAAKGVTFQELLAAAAAKPPPKKAKRGKPDPQC
jgi:hypothetical protein